MATIKEKANVYAKDYLFNPLPQRAPNIHFEAGANYVLDIVEKELTRRMLEDYNQGAEEDEVAQGCMASMIMFVRNLKDK